ncbi:glycoside hydrolase family 108 protein [Deinococcus cellulosilyticus]|uniref:TtsA-like Glycoside hydrolase family 108 domain-containing protein n=1 Tax=Deinococcus cellulosilyticus (strain DSM 18568 / NBRC 106333 / KACC 11606 / 5516J-15) TaxID=1223518 RepID=A0A511N0M7_DEIC1|nr:glycosyl hydrolase 108 family protein [Deinococcus cellulosilyticus]GEM45926.1 hypothetical protein DC3_15610 [Deinococcus cellulosilyticus NBRC 106333 = KACC 11606]
MNAFNHAVNLILGHEGGYSDDPRDPGNWTGGQVGSGVLRGTKWGIAANTYPNLDIKHLTRQQAVEIYRRDYWLAMDCDNLSAPLGLCVFDCAVNMGKGRAREFLRDTGDWEEFMAKRLEFYTNLSTFSTFGRGWARRVAGIIREAEKLEQMESLEKKTVTVYDPTNNRRIGDGTLIGSKVYLRR